jgi:hypothetical protein
MEAPASIEVFDIAMETGASIYKGLDKIAL